MTDNQLVIPQMDEPSWAESLLQTIHNGASISSIPIIAPAICALLSSRIQSMGQKRFSEFMGEFVEYVKDLDRKILESDSFIVATEITLNKIVNEHNQIKRKRFAKMYRDFIRQIDPAGESPDIDRLELFLSIVKILSDNALYSLLMLKEVGLQEPFSAGSGMNDKFKIFNERIKQKCGEHYYYRTMAELEQTGVVTQASGFWGGNVPFVTQLGLDFIEWLESDSI